MIKVLTCITGLSHRVSTSTLPLASIRFSNPASLNIRCPASSNGSALFALASLAISPTKPNLCCSSAELPDTAVCDELETDGSELETLPADRPPSANLVVSAGALMFPARVVSAASDEPRGGTLTGSSRCRAASAKGCFPATRLEAKLEPLDRASLG